MLKCHEKQFVPIRKRTRVFNLSCPCIRIFRFSNDPLEWLPPFEVFTRDDDS